MDKMKAQAAQLAQKAQEAGKAGQSKIVDVQAKRRADALLRDLGAAVYAQRTGAASGDSAAEIDRLVSELSKLESENGPLDVSEEGSSTTGTTSETEAPPEGGFTL
ncbi:MAG TPA: hypothetical protein VGZ68_00795 [Acidimicrobiales bacterium]|jgi:hypothetical protein|nr:hypothetical protein [Acidimicrobiales bacterium]